MKVCIIGNSHIAALKLGWKAGLEARLPDIRLTFFGARGGDIAELTVRDGLLAPESEPIARNLRTTSGGCAEIRPSDYDVILVYGLCRELNLQVRNLRLPYSSAALELAQLEYWAGTNLMKVIAAIREIDPRPIYAGAAPLEAAEKTGSEDSRHYDRFIRTSNQQVFALADAILFPQPARTIVNGDATDLRYAQGSTRLAVGDMHDDRLHPGSEFRHMNAEFGALWLESFLGHVRRDQLTRQPDGKGATRRAAPETISNL